MVVKRKWYGATVHQDWTLEMIDVLDRYNVETTNTSTDTTDINRIYFEAKLSEDELVILKLSIGSLHIYLRDLECSDPF